MAKRDTKAAAAAATREIDQRAATLLRRALAAPFVLAEAPDPNGYDNPVPVWEWARYLSETFPLWSFRPHAFAALHANELPMTHPLRTIVSSIVDDDGLGEANPLELGEAGWLVLTIDGRRCGIADESRAHGFSDYVERDDAGYRFIGSFGLNFRDLANGPVLASYEPDSPYTIGGYISPYEEIGVRLVEVVERRDAARAGSDERKVADGVLSKFLKDLARSVRGRPSILRDAAAVQLIDEGTRLIELCADVLSGSLEVSRQTVEIMIDQGVPERRVDDWATRLVLPNFSKPELDALRHELRTRQRGAVARGDLAREFAVHILAHRLRSPVSTIARKVLDGRIAEVIDVRDACIVCGHSHRNGTV